MVNLKAMAFLNCVDQMINILKTIPSSIAWFSDDCGLLVANKKKCATFSPVREPDVKRNMKNHQKKLYLRSKHSPAEEGLLRTKASLPPEDPRLDPFGLLTVHGRASGSSGGCHSLRTDCIRKFPMLRYYLTFTDCYFSAIELLQTTI